METQMEETARKVSSIRDENLFSIEEVTQDMTI